MSDTGWKSPGTMESISDYGVPWSNPNNAKTSDNSYTVNGGGSADGSDILKASNFGFNIPTGATIDGVIISVERHGTNNISIYTLNQIGYDIDLPIPSEDAYASFGSESELWDQELTPAIVNDSDFYMSASSAGDNSGDWEAYIDHIQMKVYYTETETPTIGTRYPLPAFKRP